MNVVQYECENCGHLSKMILQDPTYDPMVFCPRGICVNGQMKRNIITFVDGQVQAPEAVADPDGV
jgi:predicted nucleic acid-binding Zn ribbon protein